MEGSSGGSQEWVERACSGQPSSLSGDTQVCTWIASSFLFRSYRSLIWSHLVSELMHIMGRLQQMAWFLMLSFPSMLSNVLIYIHFWLVGYDLLFLIHVFVISGHGLYIDVVLVRLSISLVRSMVMSIGDVYTAHWYILLWTLVDTWIVEPVGE